MRALHRSAADIQGRADNLIYSQRLSPNGRTDNIDHRIDRADFMEMHALHGSIVNLRFRPSQCLENSDGSLSCGLRDRGRRNDLPNLRQPATMRMGVWMFVRDRVFVRERATRPRFCVLMRMLAFMMVMLMMTVAMLMLIVSSRLPFPILLPRQILLPVDVNIHLRGRNPAAYHTRNFQPRSDTECRHGFFQQPRRNSGIHQRAQKHVAAHAGKTL